MPLHVGFLIRCLFQGPQVDHRRALVDSLSAFWRHPIGVIEANHSVNSSCWPQSALGCQKGRARPEMVPVANVKESGLQARTMLDAGRAADYNPWCQLATLSTLSADWKPIANHARSTLTATMKPTS